MAVTGVAKVWTALGDVKLLAVADPIVGISFKHLILSVGVMEVAVALACLFSKRETLALGLIAWISTSFAVYRFGLWWVDWKSPCGCLGNLTDALNISPQAADNIMKLVLAYLFIGSYGMLAYEWRQKRRNVVGSGKLDPQPLTGR